MNGKQRENGTPRFQPSWQSAELLKLLRERLRRAGDLCSYEEMERRIRHSVRDGKGRGWLRTASSRLLKDDQVVTETVPTVGVLRLDPAGIVRKEACRSESQSRMSARALRELGTVDLQSLDEHGRVQTCGQMMAHKMVYEISRSRSREKFHRIASQADGADLTAMEGMGRLLALMGGRKA